MIVFYFVILYICVLQANAFVLKRSVQQQSCELMITKDGHVIDDEGVAFAVGGKENQVYCDATCTGSGMPPALRWYRYRKDGLRRKIPKLSSKRVYAVRTTHNRISILTISNMLARDIRKYTCRGWSIKEGWVEKSIYLRYSCDSSSFMCDGTRCMNTNLYCNGVRDCRDGTDEQYCDLCSEDEFKCDGRCLSKSFMCDNIADCEDAADERNCHTIPTKPPTTTSITQTFPTTSTTDFYDYDDYETESSVEFERTTTTTKPTTRTTTITPSVTQTFPTTSTLDYYDYDDTDEKESSVEPTPTTTQTTSVSQPIITTSDPMSSSENYFYYDNGVCNRDEFECDGDCIPSTSKCDGVSDCVGSEDEQNCTHLPCTHGFECETGLCIVLDWKCDGTRDCPDGSDETSCPEPTSKTTGPPTKSIDVQTTDMTSQTPPPTTSTDVKNTDMTSQTPPQTTSTEVETTDMTSQTPPPTTSSEVLTTDMTSQIPPQTTPATELTTSLTTDCDVDEFTCAPGECVPISARCDDMPDCSNEMDEENCEVLTCNEGMVSCADGLQCFSQSNKCDGEEQCLDGSDEKECSTITEEIIEEKEGFIFTLGNTTAEFTDTLELHEEIISRRDSET